jgi:hypothetical protein
VDRLRSRQWIDPSLLALWVTAVIVAVGSSAWRFQHDAPLLLYIAFATRHFDLVPYRDIFDFNLPGTYLIYRAIGTISNYTDLGVRCCDLALLGLTGVLSYRWMRPLGRRAAHCGAAMWVLAYLGGGPMFSLQREFIMMPALLLALVLNDGVSGASVARRVAAGAMWGIVATIKPHAAIGLALVVIVDIIAFVKQSRRGDVWRLAVMPTLAGFSVPICGVLIYLAQIGALPAFRDMAINYWPLYAHISGDYEPLSGLARIRYLMKGLQSLESAQMLPWFIVGGVLGAYAGLFDRAFGDVERRRVKLLIGLAVCYWIYPALAGTFSAYHWIPCTYFVVQLMALSIVDRPDEFAPARRVFCGAVIVLTLMGALPLSLLARTVLGRPLPPPKEGRVDQIAEYLHEHLQEGDTVQPLDWTGGAVHAMLIARAKIATPFLYDFYFFYDVSNEYVQGLRRRFIERFEQTRPRFVIDVGEDKARIHGPDTSLEFTALQSALGRRYRSVLAGDGFMIYERLGE